MFDSGFPFYNSSSAYEKADISKPFYQRDMCGNFRQVSIVELLPDAAEIEKAARNSMKEEEKAESGKK